MNDLGEYAIRLRIGRSCLVGRDSNGRNKYRYVHEYETNKGRFLPEEWKEVTMKAIMEADAVELLEKIKAYCSKHCAWLHKKDETEEYAMECLCSGAYLYWEDFEKETIIWM